MKPAKNQYPEQTKIFSLDKKAKTMKEHTHACTHTSHAFQL